MYKSNKLNMCNFNELTSLIQCHFSEKAIYMQFAVLHGKERKENKGRKGREENKVESTIMV